MSVPQEVLNLIERFDLHRDSYRAGQYNETQLRREFLDPFLEALGWDVNNRQGYAEAYKDVVHEDSIKVEGVPRAPDYCFRIGGVRKFFLEAKKPAVNVKEEITPAFQLRRYAWSAKLPLSVLSDFEEFAVYDARIKPDKADKASTARILYLSYAEYAQRWEDIAAIFSKEAVLKGHFDRYAEAKQGKKGTAEVDTAFLREIESWRTQLAQNLALRNPDLTQRQLNGAVQVTIDRIIFLRICEDRGIEPYSQLMALVNGPRIYPRLCELFQRADERYNSGLFHFQQEKGRPEEPDRLTLHLNIDDKLLKDLLKNLYYPDSPYEFSVLPADILGQVYEQFLGKVIRLTAGHRAVVEEKPEVKKAGGVFYTPTFVVDYIVKHTVGRWLEAKTPKQAAELKILDPACGSGSFLIGAYQYLLDWHLQRYISDGPAKWAAGKTPRLYQGGGGDWRLTSAEKKRILLNNIYGVDIDPQAVEVTKLSLLLKVLEGETEETLAVQLQLIQERALPDLGQNIKCGNSLIERDFYEFHQMDLFDEEEMYRVNAFNWQDEFSDILKEGGFDVVIGNPPYVRQETLGESKSYFQRRYQVYHGTADLYVYFIEKGMALLKPKGLFGIIVANKWMRANYGGPLRQWMKKHRIEAMIDFGDLPVFQTATTYPCILALSKETPTAEFTAVEVETLDFISLAEYVNEHRYPVRLSDLDDAGWSLINSHAQALLSRIRSVGIPLEKYAKGQIYRGVVTGFNEAFVIDITTRGKLIDEDPKSAEIIKPFLAGRDIKRYQPVKNDRYLIFTRHGINLKQYPAIERHLKQYKTQLMPKPKNWKGGVWTGRKPGTYQWYEIQDTIDYYNEFEKPKIIYPNICKKPEFTLVDNNFYTNQKCFIISLPDKYLLGILNSSVAFFLFRSILPKLRGDFYEPSYVYFKDFPIPIIDDSNPTDKARHDSIVQAVDRMLTLHSKQKAALTAHEKTMLQRQIETTDRQIDQIVYELYGLGQEEINIIEGEALEEPDCQL